jgi:hypothetical protein
MPEDWYGSHKLGAWPLPMVRLTCDRCDRRGQYRKDRLLAEHGPSIPLPTLLNVIAKAECRRKLPHNIGCGVFYVEANDPEVQAALGRAYAARKVSPGAR